MNLEPSMMMADIIENRKISRDCHKIVFNLKVEALPGQFVMIWIPGIDEIPISISHLEKETIGITVKIVGEATDILCTLKKGDRTRIRGPYGKSFEVKGDNPVLVAGGIGTAPLHFLASSLCEKKIHSSIIIGAKTESELSLVSDFKGLGCEVIMATDDGSEGFPGTASDCLKNELDNERKFDSIYCCGPEKMTRSIADIAGKRNIWGQAALERLMKCGIGLCGACAINDKLVCRDGPIFDLSMILSLSEFGSSCRDSAGRTRAIK